MKIALFDPYSLKFADGMLKWWTEQGYEVRYQQYYNPELVEWADVVWFETCDNNLKSGTKPGEAIRDDTNNYFPWDMHEMDLKGKRVIVRPIDIEVWQGHQQESRWDVVTDVVFIADHIMEVAQPETLPERSPDLKIHLIPCAVDLDKFAFREHEPGFNIAVISERWISKGTDLILQIALKLKQIDERYKIHWLGKRSGDAWDLNYFDDFIARNQLNIEITNVLPDEVTVDHFLDDKDYLLHGSHKEAFSYATAEAMAKGIKPVLHRFFGADGLWPDMTWSGIDEAISMIMSDDYNSASYREYLIQHGYTLPQMMERIDKVIKGEPT